MSSIYRTIAITLIAALGTACLQQDAPVGGDETPLTAETASPGALEFSAVRTIASEGLAGPAGVAVADDGTIYIADFDLRAILRLSPDGALTSLAGGGEEGLEDGVGADALFRGPAAIVFGPDGALYVADAPNHRIRRVDLNGTVTTVAGSGGFGLGGGGNRDGAAAEAQFNLPSGVAFDSSGNLLIVDKDNHAIRMLRTDQTVTTLAGGEEGHIDGPVDRARFSHPVGIAILPDGALIVAEHGNNSIRKIARDDVQTMSSSARPDYRGTPAPDSGLAFPSGVAVDRDGRIFVADVQNHRVVEIRDGGDVLVVAGGPTSGFVDGAPGAARFSSPVAVAAGPGSSLTVADLGSAAIREIQR